MNKATDKKWWELTSNEVSPPMPEKQVLKVKLHRMAAFLKEYLPEMSRSNIVYSMKLGHIDYFVIDGERFIAMTAKTHDFIQDKTTKELK